MDSNALRLLVYNCQWPLAILSSDWQRTIASIREMKDESSQGRFFVRHAMCANYLWPNRTISQLSFLFMVLNAIRLLVNNCQWPLAILSGDWHRTTGSIRGKDDENSQGRFFVRLLCRHAKCANYLWPNRMISQLSLDETEWCHVLKRKLMSPLHISLDMMTSIANPNTRLEYNHISMSVWTHYSY